MSDFEKIQELRKSNPDRFYFLRLQIKIENVKKKQRKGEDVYDFEIQNIRDFAREHNLSINF